MYLRTYIIYVPTNLHTYILYYLRTYIPMYLHTYIPILSTYHNCTCCYIAVGTLSTLGSLFSFPSPLVSRSSSRCPRWWRDYRLRALLLPRLWLSSGASITIGRGVGVGIHFPHLCPPFQQWTVLSRLLALRNTSLEQWWEQAMKKWWKMNYEILL